MAKKPKVSLHPVVDEIEKLLKQLESLGEPTSPREQHRHKALKATLTSASLLLRSECFSSDTVYEFPV